MKNATFLDNSILFVLASFNSCRTLTTFSRVSLSKRYNRRFKLSMCETDGRRSKRILVLGGTGRVGTETIRALVKMSPVPLSIEIAGRNQKRSEQIKNALLKEDRSFGKVSNEYEFVPIELSNEKELSRIIREQDLVIHTAGPFQRRESPTSILEIAMTANIPYIDVCDDVANARACKELHSLAESKGYTGLISTGINPGLSNLMAAEACSRLPNQQVDSLKLYYHTAGTGGIGVTVLAATFLILSEFALCFDKDGEIRKPPASEPEVMDFGGKIGPITTYLLNLPEVASLREYLVGANSAIVEAKFSTGPPIWNWLLQAMAKWTPQEWLADPIAMMDFSNFSMPVVRTVDLLSGARTGIQVVAKGGGAIVRYGYEHERLAESVGEATAAFAVEMIKKLLNPSNADIPAGILYPEELSKTIRDDILHNASRRCNFLNLEVEPTKISKESVTL